MKDKIFQQGFSLIELMITMLIGMFIIGGIISVFVSSSQNYRVQQALNEVQDKGRFAVRKLREDIRMAGFGLKASDNANAIELVGSGSATSCASGLQILVILTDNSSSSPRRCYFVDANNNLQRRAVNIDGLPTAAAVTVIEGVAQLDYSFAVDKNGDDKIDINVDQVYIPRTDIASSEWTQVVAVKIELIVSSTTENVTETPQIIINPFNKSPVDNFDAVDNRRLHQAYSAIVPIKNKIL